MGVRVRQLGELEAAIMDRLWARAEPATVRDILNDIEKERDLAYTTVMTVMDNLHRKGMVTRTHRGRAWIYRPALSREEHTAALMQQVLDTTDDRTAALLRFVEQMPASEVAKLRRALEGSRRRRRK